MQNGPKTTPMTRCTQSARPFANRWRQQTPKVARPNSRELLSAQRGYERYLALAKAQAGDVIGAENYNQHAEHYFRSTSSDRDTR